MADTCGRICSRHAHAQACMHARAHTHTHTMHPTYLHPLPSCRSLCPLSLPTLIHALKAVCVCVCVCACVHTVYRSCVCVHAHFVRFCHRFSSFSYYFLFNTKTYLCLLHPPTLTSLLLAPDLMQWPEQSLYARPIGKTVNQASIAIKLYMHCLFAPS